MNQLVFSLLMAAPGGGSGTTQQNLLGMLPIVLIIAIFYFFIIRPQNKKQKETQRMLADLKKGDRIVTIGGIHGVIQSVREGSLILKVDENCKIEFSRNAVASVESSGRAEKTSENSPEASTEEK
ncbi:MAG: preprotein translocase subunit YajC [Spirochaetaceae bacterium]|jgi:preprotein translocase subunit YajC|nr:preprotein translocase subunit YajC [Spirochaetaceae bacterium]